MEILKTSDKLNKDYREIKKGREVDWFRGVGLSGTREGGVSGTRGGGISGTWERGDIWYKGGYIVWKMDIAL